MKLLFGKLMPRKGVSLSVKHLASPYESWKKSNNHVNYMGILKLLY